MGEHPRAASEVPETARGSHYSVVLTATYGTLPCLGYHLCAGRRYTAKGDGLSELHLNTILKASLPGLVTPVYTGES